MFDVYGLSGRLFTGPIDDLRDMHQVHAVARMRALQPVSPQQATSPGLLMAGEALEAVFIQDYVDLRQRGALNAYAHTQTSTVTRQPLVLVEQLMSRRLITVPVQATLAQGMAPRIRVNAVGPGPVLRNARQSVEDFDRQRDATLLGHGADPADICAAVRFLLDAPSVTGQMIAVDGGQHLIWQTPDTAGHE